MVTLMTYAFWYRSYMAVSHPLPQNEFAVLSSLFLFVSRNLISYHLLGLQGLCLIAIV